jgi:hypothetical protein
VVSRRRLLRSLAAAAAAGVAAAAAAPRAAFAGSDGDVVLGAPNAAGPDETSIGSEARNTLALYNFAYGRALYAYGGDSNTAITAVGDYQGLYAKSKYSNAVEGHIQNPDNPFSAVYGVSTTKSGNGVFGEVVRAGGTGSGVLAIHNGIGSAVLGIHREAGNAITGSSAKGRGGEFSGNRAQVRLKPGSGASHPPSGKVGDLYVDKNERLWFCKGGATWVQLA